jgi:hypothetical protein
VGLCTLAIALAWRNRRRRLRAIPVLGLAYTAHVLPVVWALGVIAYVMMARRFRASLGPWLCAVGLASIAAVALFLKRFVVAGWPSGFLFDSLFGVDQVLAFGANYRFLAA